MRWAQTVGLLFFVTAVPAIVHACQPCEVWEIGSLRLRIVAQEDDSPVGEARVVLRKATKRAEPREPARLTCSDSYERGKRVFRGKTDRNGEIALPSLPEGSYWLAVYGAEAQVVRLMYIPEALERTDKAITVSASENGWTPNMCGWDKAKPYL